MAVKSTTLGGSNALFSFAIFFFRPYRVYFFWILAYVVYQTAKGLVWLGLGDSTSAIITGLIYITLACLGAAYLDQHIRDKQDRIINGTDK